MTLLRTHALSLNMETSRKIDVLKKCYLITHCQHLHKWTIELRGPEGLLLSGLVEVKIWHHVNLIFLLVSRLIFHIDYKHFNAATQFLSTWLYFCVLQFIVETYYFAEGRCLFKQSWSSVYQCNLYDEEILPFVCLSVHPFVMLLKCLRFRQGFSKLAFLL